MSKAAKYVELVFKDGGLPKNKLAGYVIVSDYMNDQGRNLVLKQQAKEVPTPRKKRAPQAEATQT